MDAVVTIDLIRFIQRIAPQVRGAAERERLHRWLQTNDHIQHVKILISGDVLVQQDYSSTDPISMLVAPVRNAMGSLSDHDLVRLSDRLGQLMNQIEDELANRTQNSLEAFSALPLPSDIF